MTNILKMGIRRPKFVDIPTRIEMKYRKAKVLRLNGIMRIRLRHHRIARLFAAGYNYKEVARMLGRPRSSTKFFMTVPAKSICKRHHARDVELQLRSDHALHGSDASSKPGDFDWKRSRVDESDHGAASLARQGRGSDVANTDLGQVESSGRCSVTQ